MGERTAKLGDTLEKYCHLSVQKSKIKEFY